MAKRERSRTKDLRRPAATEMQGRIVGAFREQEPPDIRRLTDEELVTQLSDGDSVLAAILRAHLQRQGMPVRP